MNDKLAVQSPGLAYRLLSIPLYLFWILHGVKHGAKHGLPDYLSMRLFGFAGDGGGDRVWVHASSVGEVRAVSPLVQALVRQGEAVLFTSFTATGYQAIRHQFSDAVTSGVIPLDSIWNCRGFFRRHRIKLGLVMETELWPELLYQARRQQVELILVNARLSRKSLDAGGFVRGLLTRSLGYFRLILTRNQRDLEALLSLGASAQRTTIIGNLKTHIESGQQHSRLIERDYLILASSHSGEELQFLEARPAQLADRLLVLAPRHPERGAAIEIQLENLGLRFAVRS